MLHWLRPALLCAAFCLTPMRASPAAEDSAPTSIDEARRLSSEEPQRFLADSASWLASRYAQRNPDWKRELLLRRGRAAWYLSDRKAAAAARAELEALASSASMPLARAYALLLTADEETDAGRSERAIRSVSAAADIFRATGDPHWRAIANLELCDAFWGSEREELALSHCRRAETHLREVGDDWHLARLENIVAILFENAGDVAGALAMAQSSRDRYARLGMPAMVAAVEDNMSSLYIARGEPEQALALSLRSLASELASGKLQHAVASRQNIAAALSALGRHEEALKQLRQAIVEAEANGLGAKVPGLYGSIVDAAEAAGDEAQALEAAKQMITLKSEFDSERSELAIAEIQEQLEAAERRRELQQQAARLAQQELRLWLVSIGVGAFALVSLLLFALWRSSRRQGERLRHLAEIDGLTQVLNRRTFVERLKSVSEALAEGGCATVALIDADHFKRINDTRGHQVGDRTLQRIAAALGEDLADGDAVGRLGGEEFALLYVGADAFEAVGRAEAVRARIAHDHQRPGGLGFEVTVSIGLATLRAGEAARVEDWLHAADKALYAAKAAGRNRVQVAAAVEAGRLEDPAAAPARP